MTPDEEYELVMDFLIPNYGEVSFSQKRELAELARANPTAILYPATEKEVQTILDYLNSRPIVVDFIDHPAFYIYKDVAFRVSRDHSHWEIHNRNVDRLSWEMLGYLHDHEISMEDARKMNLSRIYEIK